MAMNPRLRAVLTHGISVAGGAWAMVVWGGDHVAEIQAAIEQGKVVYGEVMKFLAIVGPLAGAAISFYNTSIKNKLKDVEGSGKVAGVVVTDAALASELGPKVQMSASALPVEAHAPIFNDAGRRTP